MERALRKEAYLHLAEDYEHTDSNQYPVNKADVRNPSIYFRIAWFV